MYTYLQGRPKVSRWVNVYGNVYYMYIRMCRVIQKYLSDFKNQLPLFETFHLRLIFFSFFFLLLSSFSFSYRKITRRLKNFAKSNIFIFKIILKTFSPSCITLDMYIYVHAYIHMYIYRTHTYNGSFSLLSKY